MKSFKQFIKEQEGKPLYKIYCDMDGVLVDFMNGIMRTVHLAKEPNVDEIEEFLATLEGSSSDWWSSLEWQDGGKQLWKVLKELNTEILTACPVQCKLQPNVIKGKKLWCKQNLKKTSGINITTRRGRLKFAAPSHILIDDKIKNCNEWKAAGGFAIHHRSPKQTVKELKDKLLG